MAFTANQLLTFSDLQILVDTEEYYPKATFSLTNQLVTKTDIIAALYLDGTNPLASYTATQLVRYGDIAPLGTAWVGDEFFCVDDNPDNPPTAPTIVLGQATSTSINVDWSASPGTDDGSIYLYVIEMTLASAPTSWGNTHTISDILTTPRNYTYSPLELNTSYLFRVRAVDNIGQYSPYSNTLTASTLGEGNVHVLNISDLGTNSGEIYCYLNGPTANETLTLELTITSAGVISPYDEWAYRKYASAGSVSGWVLGETDSVPVTTTHVVQRTSFNAGAQLVAMGTSYRTPTNFYGYAYATIKILNSTSSFDNTAHTFNIIGSSSGQ